MTAQYPDQETALSQQGLQNENNYFPKSDYKIIKKQKAY